MEKSTYLELLNPLLHALLKDNIFFLKFVEVLKNHERIVFLVIFILLICFNFHF